MPWNNPDQLLVEFFKTMGTIRKEEIFMHEADIKVRNINVNFASFERIKDKEKMLVVVNRTGREQEFVLPDEYKSSENVYILKKSKPGIIGPYGGVAIKV